MGISLKSHTSPIGRSQIPKGPFCTKNSTALESIVFGYRRSFSLSVPFSCVFCPQKQAFLSPLRSVLLRPYRIFSPHRNSLSVVFLVRECLLGTLSCNRPRPTQGLPGPSGLGTPEESERSPERAPWGRTPKVPPGVSKESKKSPKVRFSSLLRLF